MRIIAIALLLIASSTAGAQSKDNKRPAATPDSSKFTTGLLSGLKLRSIGPALTSGRISDIAIDPTNKRTWYVGVSAGGVWKSTNGGISFSPIFDGQGSFSIGTVNIDPANPNVIWVGTGENNAQRVVAYGDGIYKSIDGGRSWTNMGLKTSEHIGRVLIDPRNSDVVYVAAQGPLWRKGGERGLYKTTDGGKTWNKILGADDWTGVNDVQMDPRNPDMLVATTWQRHRRVFTFVAGGPGSGVWRSTDGGKTWTKSQSGFPDVELGRIGLSVSPANPNVIYAVADAADNKGGFFRSRDFGASWEKMSNRQSGGNYYNEIFADPKNVDRVFLIEPILQVSNDGGKTFGRVGERNKHVDNHSVWVDPDEPTHHIVGTDGGIYETFDNGKTHRFTANLPITQYYRVSTDDSKPFYRVFGGSQDNFSVGGPSRTRNTSGITNADWFITAGGDGFGSVVDPTDPNIVYAQSQFGNLSRFNLRTGDVMGIQPTEEPGTPGPRWGWDAPLFISPHDHKRLYFASNRVFVSHDRGDSWKVISPDVSRLIDRNRLRSMDRVIGLSAVGKNVSTTLFGIALTIAESPLKEGVLFVGSDDGKISVSENSGATWRSVDHVRGGVPDTAPVFKILPSQHDVNVVYAAFNNHQAGDFKPYVMKSTDMGRTWSSITGNLPSGSVYSLAEDHVDRNLLFAGTEWGLFVTRDGGRKWLKLNGGLPTIQVRDLAIQKRENDLVLGTFGRGFYILDDYTSLRTMTDEALASNFVLFPTRPAPLYVPSSPLGLPDAVGPSFQGAAYYQAENPPYGAVFTYYMKSGLKSRREARLAAEKELVKKGADVFYPPWDSLKAEDREEGPGVVVTVSDSNGRPIRRFSAPSAAGINRVAWDLKLQPSDPVTGPPYEVDPDWPFSSPPAAPYVVPGEYQVSFATRVNGTFTPLGQPQRFQVVGIDGPGARTMATLADQQRAAALQRSVLGLEQVVTEALGRMALFKRAVDETPTADASLQARVRAVTDKLKDAQEMLGGDRTMSNRYEPSPPSLLDRLGGAIGANWCCTLEAPTPMQKAEFDLVRSQFDSILAHVRQLIDVELKGIEQTAEQAGVPWTSGRFPKAPAS